MGAATVCTERVKQPVNSLSGQIQTTTRQISSDHPKDSRGLLVTQLLGSLRLPFVDEGYLARRFAGFETGVSFADVLESEGFFID